MPTMASNGLPVPTAGMQNYLENGRLYHGYRRGLYMFPCDEQEMDRLDLFHKIFEIVRRSALHAIPLQDNPDDPPRILDVGCGTGIWAIDMADKYTSAEVVGLDLVNIQPEKIPPNARFRVPRDYESIWNLGECSWDLIHVQMACGSVASWPELYQKIYAHLKPGVGHIEQVEIDFQPRCDDGTLSAESPLNIWYNYLADATERGAKPIAFQHNTKEMLSAAGFIDIREQIIRLPLNSWPRDPYQKIIGRWYMTGMGDALQALSLAPFTRALRWTPEQLQPLLDDVYKEIFRSRVHAYNNIHIITARRPI